MMSRKTKKAIIIVVIVVFAIALAVITYLRIQQNLSGSSGRGPSVPLVTISNPITGTVTKKLSYTGDIIPIQQANIYSRVNGNIRNIFHDVGDYVGKGTLLAVIDNSAYIQSVRQTEAVLNQAKANYENNKTNLSRVKQLLDKGLTTQADFDNAETTLRVSAEQIQSAEASYNNAVLNLDYCNIRAPFSGYITKKYLDVGSLCAANSQSQSNVIFIISDISTVKVVVNILEKDLQLINITDEAEIKTSTYPEEIFKGKIRKFSQSVDLNTRTMPVEIILINRDNKLKPGMFANIDIILEEKNDVVLIPVECVLKDNTGNFVYTINSDTVATKTYVETGHQQDNKYEIISGITENDKIVFIGQQLIKEGGKVKLSK